MHKIGAALHTPPLKAQVEEPSAGACTASYSDLMADSKASRITIAAERIIPLSRLSFEDFETELKAINACVRGVSCHLNDYDGGSVLVGNNVMETLDFLPPKPEQKVPLLKQFFEAAQSVDDPKIAGLLLYLGIQALHLFNDGNGRTGRAIYCMLNPDCLRDRSLDLEQVINHDLGERSAGRELFFSIIKPVEDIYGIANKVLAHLELRPELMNGVRSVYSGVMVGIAHIPESLGISPKLRDDLIQRISEGPRGRSVGDFAMVDLVDAHPELGLPLENDPRGILRFDGEKLLKMLTSPLAEELLEHLERRKQEGIKTLIAICLDPIKYNSANKPIRDLFFAN